MFYNIFTFADKFHKMDVMKSLDIKASLKISAYELNINDISQLIEHFSNFSHERYPCYEEAIYKLIITKFFDSCTNQLERTTALNDLLETFPNITNITLDHASQEDVNFILHSFSELKSLTLTNGTFSELVCPTIKSINIKHNHHLTTLDTRSATTLTVSHCSLLTTLDTHLATTLFVNSNPSLTSFVAAMTTTLTVINNHSLTSFVAPMATTLTVEDNPFLTSFEAPKLKS